MKAATISFRVVPFLCNVPSITPRRGAEVVSAYVLSTYFQLRLHNSDGNQFQDLFNDLMARCHDGYSSVAPWGNHGDRGNDGYVPSELRFFQLYAPISAGNPTTSCSKAVGDFSKLEAAYPGLKHYHFVMNDKFKGIPAPVAESLHALKKSKSKLGDCTPIGSHQLRSKFEKLPQPQQILIVGDLPSRTPDDLDLTTLGALLKDLADADDDSVHLDRIDLPAEFDVKAQFNGFSDGVKALLTHYARRSHLVERMLTSRDASWLQAVSEEVKDRYQKIPIDIASDDRLWRLSESLIPKVAQHHTHSLKAYREASLLVIAKYFEACDVFENPNSIAPAKTH